MRRAIYYHVAGLNHWREIVLEQLRLLRGCPYPITIGWTGSQSDAGFLWHAAVANDLKFNIVPDLGAHNFEFPTLEILQRACRDETVDEVLYFHSKGASRLNDWTATMWRCFMNAYILTGINQAFDALEDHAWAAPVLSEGLGHGLIHSCGNFWTARADHIRSLPDITEFRNGWAAFKDRSGQPSWAEPRHAAEIWISTRPVHIKQLHQGGDCNISNTQWWCEHPEFQQLAINKGS